MLHVLAIFLPPWAVWICRRRQIYWNILLTLLFWIPGMVHALWIVSECAPDEYARHVYRVRSAQRRPAPSGLTESKPPARHSGEPSA